MRQAPADTIIAAPGTICRHQIQDGTGRRAFYPAEILFDTLAQPLPSGGTVTSPRMP
ncbi:MAG: hypothetical protein PHQ04_03360 [Opitutaceae bacterium]|nr:hypothetical protein [Opitutaceae bacterium]